MKKADFLANANRVTFIAFIFVKYRLFRILNVVAEKVCDPFDFLTPWKKSSSGPIFFYTVGLLSCYHY